MGSATHSNFPTAAAMCLLLSIIIAVSCGCSRQARDKRIVERLIGREIILPESLNVINADQIKNTELLSSEGKIKVLFYIGQEECSACRVSDIHFADTLFKILPPKELIPLVIVNPDDDGREETLQKLHDGWFEFPIYDDSNSAFMELNPTVPKDSRFHSFLLDEYDKVILVGNPARSPQILDLYMEMLSGLYEE